MTWHQSRGIAAKGGIAVLLNTPEIRQAGEYDCGRAAARIVLGSYKVPEADAVGMTGTLRVDKLNGTDPAEMVTWFRSHGWSVTEGSTDVPTVRHHCDHGRPVILLATLHGGGHWTVCRGVSRGRIYFQDPFNGRWDMRTTEFDAVWKDANKYGTTFSRWAVVAVPT